MSYVELMFWGMIFLIALTAVGGWISLTLEHFYRKRNPDWAQLYFHGTKWDKNLQVQPRHELCSPCAQAVAEYKEHHARRDAARRS